MVSLFLKLISILLFVYVLATLAIFVMFVVKALLKRFKPNMKHILVVFFWFIFIFVKEFKKEVKDIF